MKTQALITLVVVGFLSLILTELAHAETTKPQPVVVGGVNLIQGKVYAIGSDGEKRRLHRGSAIHEGETIKTIGEGAVVLLMQDGAIWDIYDESEIEIVAYHSRTQILTVSQSGRCASLTQYLIKEGEVTYSEERVEGECTIIQVGDKKMELIGTTITVVINKAGIVITITKGSVTIDGTTYNEGITLTIKGGVTISGDTITGNWGDDTWTIKSDTITIKIPGGGGVISVSPSQ